MAESSNRHKSFFDKLKHKYRLVIYNDVSIEEVLSLHLSRLNVFAYMGISVILIVVLVFMLIVFTPLREFVPRMPDSKLQRNIVMNAIRLDSLENRLKLSDQYYLDNIKSVLSGGEPLLLEQEPDTFADMEQIDFSKSRYDSLLRVQIDSEEQFNLSISEEKPVNRGISNLHFFSPVNKGVVINEFNPDENHFGIDIVAEANEGVKAILPGTVINAAWTLSTGYVIQMQHQDNLISSYKHNAVLMKKIGDKVKAGETIAIIGNSGELTSGPHLHFELWHNGTPIDPQNYIAF